MSDTPQPVPDDIETDDVPNKHGVHVDREDTFAQWFWPAEKAAHNISAAAARLVIDEMCKSAAFQLVGSDEEGGGAEVIFYGLDCELTFRTDFVGLVRRFAEAGWTKHEVAGFRRALREAMAIVGDE